MSLSATADSHNVVYIGSMKETFSDQQERASVAVATIPSLAVLAEYGVKKTADLENMPIPGDNIKKRRLDAGLSMRGLAEKCNPEIDHTTVRRIEVGIGFTQDTLERIAVALGCDVTDFFLPEDLQGWSELTDDDRRQIGSMVKNAVMAARYKKAGGLI